MIGAVIFSNSITSTSLTEIIWDEELRVKGYNKSIIDEGKESTLLSFFNINFQR